MAPPPQETPAQPPQPWEQIKRWDVLDDFRMRTIFKPAERGAWMFAEDVDAARASDAETIRQQAQRIAELEVALVAARQFLTPGIDRGPSINGWQNTVDLVDAALSRQKEGQ